jgi:NADH-quinone oxidoreductase subunit E
MAQTKGAATTFDFSPETRARAQEMKTRYPEGKERSALLPMLHLVQSEEGFVSADGIAFCAETLGLTKAEVGAVATFYTMYKRGLTGDWLVSVCTNTMCDVLGGRRVFEMLSEYLDVGHDETTADGKITLEHAECLAACDYGPVLTVNYDFFDNVTPETAVGIVEELRAGGRPVPARGARLCTLKEMSVQLAGFPDTREAAVGDGVPGEPTLRGLRLAQEHGIAVSGFDPNTPIKRKDDAKPADAKPTPKASPPAAPAPPVTPVADADDKKDPQVRTAEARQPDASTPAGETAATEGPVDRAPGPKSAGGASAEAAGVAANRPASDAKPAGDTPADPLEANLDAADAEVGKQRSQEGSQEADK